MPFGMPRKCCRGRTLGFRMIEEDEALYDPLAIKFHEGWQRFSLSAQHSKLPETLFNFPVGFALCVGHPFLKFRLPISPFEESLPLITCPSNRGQQSAACAPSS